ncbi:MAG: DUF6067 family protein [Planctomycetota bacterium]
MTRFRCLLCFFLLALPAGAAETRTTVLGPGSWLRYNVTWKTEMVAREGGKVEPIRFGKRTPTVTVYGLPDPGWRKPEFDDRSWDRTRGRLGASWGMGLLCLRAKFRVTDPAKARGLRLSADFIGGAVVYVNGRELAREGMPNGEIEPTTPALELPKEAYVDPDGYLYRNAWGDPQRYADRLKARVRHIVGAEIPARMLRKGVNVVAVEVHRAPASEILLTGKPRRAKQERWRGRSYYWWSRAGFKGLTLTAPGGAAGVVPNTGRPDGFQVWNHPITKRVHVSDYGDPTEPLRPVRLVGARNAVLSDQVVAGSPGPLKGLTAAAGKLAGPPGSIPETAVEVRYLRRDGDRGGTFGSLVPGPPQKPHAVLPIWIRVRVPKDAAPGDYSGEVTISADGAGPVTVPIELTVVDWTMPDPKAFTSHVGLIQSPETLAMKYDVPLWSDRHWELIDRSFELLGEVGTKVVHIPIIRRTHFGNVHSRVRWIRAEGGGYRHDFSLVEKYLDTAIGRLGKVPVVNFYCWEMYTGGKYFGHKGRKGKGMCFTIHDPETGKLTPAEGPKWGDPETVAFWKPVFTGLRDLLKERGMEQSFMLGVAGDSRPTKEAGHDMHAAAPWAKFVVHSHGRASNIWKIPVGYLADVWGAPSAPDPAKARRYGWKSSFLRTTFPRAGSNTVGSMRPSTPLAMWYVSLEAMQTAGIHGFGRMGADFWPVLKEKHRRGGRTLLARFPESRWAQLSAVNSAHFVIAPGKDGAVPTVRYEMIRCAQQQAEARVFIEKALTDPKKKARLGADLAGRAQELLDARVRANNHGKANWGGYLSSGWQERSAGLYRAAAQVAAGLR